LKQRVRIERIIDIDQIGQQRTGRLAAEAGYVRAARMSGHVTISGSYCLSDQHLRDQATVHTP
jgi:hypothetical protein